MSGVVFGLRRISGCDRSAVGDGHPNPGGYLLRASHRASTGEVRDGASGQAGRVGRRTGVELATARTVAAECSGSSPPRDQLSAGADSPPAAEGLTIDPPLTPTLSLSIPLVGLAT